MYALTTLIAAYSTCFGATYNWPIAESVDIDIVDSKNAWYTLHMTTITIDDPTILPTTTTADVILRHWGSTLNVSWGYYHRHNPSSDSRGPSAAVHGLEAANKSLPFVRFANELALKHGKGTITLPHNGSPNGNECVGTTMYSWLIDNTSDFDSWLTSQWNGGAGTAGNCLGTPPAHEWCALTQPAVTLSHGRATLKDAAGNIASGSVGVECTTAMKFSLRLRAANNIALSNGMTSHLTVDGRELGSEINGTAGANVVAIQSTLQGTPQGAGPFEGHGVLMVSYP